MISGLRRFGLRVQAFLRPSHTNREIEREIGAHLDLLEDDLTRRGMSPDEARRAARRALGNVELTKERSRDERSFPWLEDARRDTARLLRSFVREPGFFGVAIVTLAVGIGATTAIFTVVNGIVLEPLPYNDSERLVAVLHSMPGVDADDAPLSRAMYLTYREHARSLEAIALWRTTSVSVTGEGEPEQVDALIVTDGLFELLAVEPIFGRTLTAEETAPGGEPSILLSEGYWRRRFGGEPEVLGRTLRVNGTDRAIVGVIPEGIELERQRPSLYLPLVIDPATTRVGGWSFPAVARLRPAVSLEQAGHELTSLTSLATETYPGIPLAELEARDFSTYVRPLKDDVLGEAAGALWIVFGTTGIVLLIACINVANLFLVRSEVRSRDVTLRAALGASKGRLARQSIVESLVIGALGGAGGLALALAALELFLAIAPAEIPRLSNVSVSPRVVLFTLGVSLVSGLLFGTVPAIRHARRDVASALREGGRGLRSRGPLRSLFAVSQVALAFVLLVAAGLMVRSFQAMKRVPPGFHEPESVLTFRLSIPTSEATSGEEAARAHERILERVAAVPGVEAASAATSVAMDSWDSWDDVFVEDFPELDETAKRFRRFNWIAPGYFATIQNRLLAGRDFSWRDLHERGAVAIVTENFARELWGEPRRAVGRRIRSDEEYPWSEIVGVVENVHTRGLDEPPPSLIYLPFFMGQFWERDFAWRDLRYSVRTSRDLPAALVPEMREAVWSVNRNLPLYDVMTLEQILERSMSRASFTLVLLTLAAVVALFLGMVGVYGVISYLVAERRREMGLRLAMGARPRDIALLVVRQGARLGALGLAAGILAASSLTRLMDALLFEVRSSDPPTFGVLALALGGIVLLASYVPARRAAAVDPTEALRLD